ncbi:MAG: PEP-CTERM sorting domain-containing protein [Nostocales cyanobacterium 94392]|nr:PEP-CTERM sorting domain-containing protein [Nostocales cyanobacterium 94392]
MRINKLFSGLSSSALLATVVTIAANPAQAANTTNNQYVEVEKLVTENQKVNITFDENVGVGSNPLYGGTQLDNLWSNYGLKLDSSLKKGGKSELWLFDSNCQGTTCTGDDPDLATGKGQNGNLKYKSPEQGKVLIIQEDNGKNDLEPDDYADRNNPGTIKFDFNEFTDGVGVLFNSISLLDFDDPGDPIFSAIFADGTSTGNFIYNANFFTEIDVENNDSISGIKDKKADNKFVVKDINANSTYISEMKLLSTSWDGNRYVTGDNSLREYNFDFGDKRVTQFNITLPGSGAVTGLNYHRQVKTLKTVKRKVPEPTSILGLVAVSAVIGSSLKRKYKSSNI